MKINVDLKDSHITKFRQKNTQVMQIEVYATLNTCREKVLEGLKVHER